MWWRVKWLQVFGGMGFVGRNRCGTDYARCANVTTILRRHNGYSARDFYSCVKSERDSRVWHWKPCSCEIWWSSAKVEANSCFVQKTCKGNTPRLVCENSFLCLIKRYLVKEGRFLCLVCLCRFWTRWNMVVLAWWTPWGWRTMTLDDGYYQNLDCYGWQFYGAFVCLQQWRALQKKKNPPSFGSFPGGKKKIFFRFFFFRGLFYKRGGYGFLKAVNSPNEC